MSHSRHVCRMRRRAHNVIRRPAGNESPTYHAILSPEVRARLDAVQKRREAGTK